MNFNWYLSASTKVDYSALYKKKIDPLIFILNVILDTKNETEHLIRKFSLKIKTVIQSIVDWD
jgi:hypothetical protein